MQEYDQADYDYNTRVTLWRNFTDGKIKDIPLKPNITLILDSSELPENADCAMYAYGVTGMEWVNRAVESLSWEEVKDPQQGDYVLYFRNPTDEIYTHVGVLQEGGMVRSKWDEKGDVYEHPMFGVPITYGNFTRIVRDPDKDYQLQPRANSAITWNNA